MSKAHSVSQARLVGAVEPESCVWLWALTAPLDLMARAGPMATVTSESIQKGSEARRTSHIGADLRVTPLPEEGETEKERLPGFFTGNLGTRRQPQNLPEREPVA